MDTECEGQKKKAWLYFDSRWIKYKEVEEVIKRAWSRCQEGSEMYQVQGKIKKLYSGTAKVEQKDNNQLINSNKRNKGKNGKNARTR